MIKKFLIVLFCLFYAVPSFALDPKELNLEFFEKFNDECLMYYINSALADNHDLKEATNVVEQYRQQVKYSLGKEMPSFSVSANYLGLKVPQLDNFQLKQNAFILPFTASYEADFLLKNRDKTRSAKKTYEANKYEEKAVYIALLSDVATTYANVLEYDELLKTAKENIKIYTNILEYDTKKFERGVITSIQLNNSQKNLEAAKNEYEKLKKQQEVLLMELAILSGISPENAQNLQRKNLNDFEYKGNIPSSITSDILFARPDIMAAETKLEKAKIDVRIARKEFLPTFNITGLWAFNTIAPGAFFSWESSIAALLAGATQDIFKGGMKIANLKIQKARYEELFESYKQTSLEATKEINTSLCFIKHDKKIENNTLKKLEFEEKNLNSAKQKLKQGIISKPEYLFNFSTFINAENEAISAKTQRIVNYFTLYKAVGGQL